MTSESLRYCFASSRSRQIKFGIKHYKGEFIQRHLQVKREFVRLNQNEIGLNF